MFLRSDIMEKKCRKVNIFIRLFIVLLVLYLANMGYYFCFIAGSLCMYRNIGGYHYYLGKQFWWIGNLVDGMEYKIKKLKYSQGYYDNLSEKEYQKYVNNVVEKDVKYQFETINLTNIFEVEQYIKNNQKDYLNCKFSDTVFYSESIFELEMERLEKGLQDKDYTFRNNAIFAKNENDDVLLIYFTMNGFVINKNIFEMFRTKEISDAFQNFIEIINNGYMSTLIYAYDEYFMENMRIAIENIGDVKFSDKIDLIILLLVYGRISTC